MAHCCRARTKSIAVGPHLFRKSTAYWEEHRHKNVTVAGTRASYHLPLDSMDEVWEDHVYEVRSVMQGLRQLHLPFVVDKSNRADCLENTSLPSFVQLAAPTLVYLTLENFAHRCSCFARLPAQGQCAY